MEKGSTTGCALGCDVIEGPNGASAENASLTAIRMHLCSAWLHVACFFFALHVKILLHVPGHSCTASA